jgi:hypothetical protein
VNSPSRDRMGNGKNDATEWGRTRESRKLPMRMLLNFPDPSPDWRGLAHVISKSDGLRDDVTFVVESDTLRFFDSECREIATGVDPKRWTQGRMRQLSDKLSLLDWLHERFPRETPAAVSSEPVNRLAASFFKDEGAGRDSHLASSQSTS